MWKNHQDVSLSISTPSAHSGAAPSSPAHELSAGPAALPRGESTIGKGLTFKGSITGGNDLFIDGKVEGSIELPDHRIIVGCDGEVTATIAARDVVVQGRVSGKVTASGRVDVCSTGFVSCDVTAARISIGDGAFFKGSVDLCEGAMEEAVFEVSIVDVPELSRALLELAPSLQLASRGT
jgi:cytoskeletal protein CcmA (bactofilin family)